MTPEPREPLFSLTKKDFRLRWFSGTGAGGQHRNKHQNCCEITHTETGVSAVAQGSRSRQTNQREAFRTLVGRLSGYLKRRAHDDGEGEPRDRHSVPGALTVVRTYHAERNEVRDHKSTLRAPFQKVLDDPASMIEGRRLAHANDS